MFEIPIKLLLKDERGGFFSGLFGGGSNKSSKKADKALISAQKAQEDSLRQQMALQGEQAGLLKPFQEQQLGAMGGLLGAAQAPAMEAFRTELSAPDREAIEGQFAQAKEGIMSGGAPGGLQRRMLGSLDIGRAQAVSQALANARQLGINRAFQFAGGQNPLGTTSALLGGAQGVSSAAGNLANTGLGVAGLAGQQAAARGQGIGSLLGTGLGLLGRAGNYFGGPVGGFLGSLLG